MRLLFLAARLTPKERCRFMFMLNQIHSMGFLVQNAGILRQIVVNPQGHLSSNRTGCSDSSFPVLVENRDPILSRCCFLQELFNATRVKESSVNRKAVVGFLNCSRGQSFWTQ